MGAHRVKLVYCNTVVSCHLDHDSDKRFSRGNHEAYLRDEAWFLPRLYECAIKAGVAGTASEVPAGAWPLTAAASTGAGTSWLASTLPLTCAASGSAAGCVGWLFAGSLSGGAELSALRLRLEGSVESGVLGSKIVSFHHAAASRVQDCLVAAASVSVIIPADWIPPQRRKCCDAMRHRRTRGDDAGKDVATGAMVPRGVCFPAPQPAPSSQSPTNASMISGAVSSMSNH